MELQNFEKKNQKIKELFLELKAKSPDKLKRRLNLSWSNWGFGIESLVDSAERLRSNVIEYIELHGNRYGDDLGYRPEQVRKIVSDYGITVAGICGMFSPDNDLSSNRGIIRQNAIDYIRRNVDLGRELGVTYMLIVPGAVGRPEKIDDSEFDRSVETIRIVADVFVAADIKAAVEPIRSAEVSFCHTLADAKRYIEEIDHPGVKHINADIYHMLTEEAHPFQSIMEYGELIVNLHMADTNRCALGTGCLDLDTLITALYLKKYNDDRHFITPEPLGPGGDPYPAMYGKEGPRKLDQLVEDTVKYFREREEMIKSTKGALIAPGCKNSH